jgi:hypothetical protein
MPGESPRARAVPLSYGHKPCSDVESSRRDAARERARIRRCVCATGLAAHRGVAARRAGAVAATHPDALISALLPLVTRREAFKQRLRSLPRLRLVRCASERCLGAADASEPPTPRNRFGAPVRVEAVAAMEAGTLWRLTDVPARRKSTAPDAAPLPQRVRQPRAAPSRRDQLTRQRPSRRLGRSAREPAVRPPALGERQCRASGTRVLLGTIRLRDPLPGRRPVFAAATRAAPDGSRGG